VVLFALIRVHSRLKNLLGQALREDALHYVAVDVGQSIVPTLELKRQFLVIDSETVQHRRVQVVNMHRVFNDIE
jgi:uncharacterized protein (UPF0212 family)